MSKKFGVVLSVLFTVWASAAIAGSSDDEAQKAIDRIVEEGSVGRSLEPAIPVADTVPVTQPHDVTDADVQKHIDQVVEEGSGESYEPGFPVTATTVVGSAS